MPAKLYNVLLLDLPGNPSKWKAEFASWEALNREIIGDGASNFNPLTIKAFYVTGIILAACKSVTLLLNKSRSFQETFFPAYIVFASAIELLGRCMNGNSTPSENTKDLTTGFKWLASPKVDSIHAVPDNNILIKTINYEYQIMELVNFRHFCAHGQAVNRLQKEFDYHILGELPLLLGKGIEAWLTELTINNDLATRLAKALVTPYRSAPITKILFSYRADAISFPESIGNEIKNLDWKYNWDKILCEK